MREILFKAKRVDNGKWEEGYFAIIGKRNVIIKAQPEDYFCVDGEMQKRNGNEILDIYPKTVCQYTGLTDKNGKKIWENDIVLNEWCFTSGNSVVRFGEYKDFHMSEKYQCGNLGFYLEHMNSEDDRIVRKDMMYFAGKCEVIGNIFDNQELLEVV